MGLRLPALVMTLALSVAVAAVLMGCSAQGATFVDGNASYDETSVMALTDGIDTSKFAETPSTKAPDLRHQALTMLRSRGGTAVPIADMVTRTFSAETRSVPVYFERASFKGKPVVVVVEAAGPANGTLATKRVWVLDEQGGVVFMGAR